MPHATNDDGRDMAAENDAADAYLRDNNFEGLGQFIHNDEFDQSGKDDGAVDYEDISDDDLPEEEEAQERPDADEAEAILRKETEALPPAPTNGFHDTLEPENEEMFGLGENNDLFGESLSSPELERAKLHEPAVPRPGGLALPGKSGLALPTFSGGFTPTRPEPRQAHSPSAQSPPSFRGDSFARTSSPSSAVDSDDESDEDEDELVRQQRRMLRAAKRRGAGLEVDDDDVELDLSTFYTFFPSYERDQNPRFVEFFPPRPVTYRGKVPLKPPKPVHPTKLTLDLLPDQERTFKTAATGPATAQDGVGKKGLISVQPVSASNEDSEDDLALSDFDENEMIGGIKMQDLALICEDWEIASLGDSSTADAQDDIPMEGEWESEERARPAKKQKTGILDTDVSCIKGRYLSFEHPEEAAARLSKAVLLDLNDPNLLIDEHAPQTKKTQKRVPADIGKDPTLSKGLVKRYNVSNDEAYDLLKENHQNKVRSTLGSMAVEHSLPARKLQYPFYKVALDQKNKRNFHRPSLVLIDRGREYKFQKPKLVKKKERRGKELKDLFGTSESLALNDNANALLLEYSEEAPMMLSNFGMGNRLINYYRKRNADDQERPKREVGETQVLLTQDKSPFANFGHVDQGEVVPTIQNGMYRAPVFQHQPKSNDFLINISTTHQGGSRLYLRNVENLHTVGQQFPLVEVPGEHSRKVTDAAKKRLQALSYRIYTKSLQPGRRDKQLDNATIMVHLKGHDMPQTRSKMREFMKYEKVANRDGVGVWVPPPGKIVPDAETMRDWVKPEDVCLLDSMQTGVQHLHDLGISTGKDAEEDKDDETGSIEAQLAPWRITKNFINATQGKAMLKLHGDGEPTGRGEGFSFVRTSMKGGFQALGESVEDRLDAKKRRDNGGHSYNVAKQQKAYDDYIRMIWDKQKQSLTNDAEMSDMDMDDEPEPEPESAYPYSRAGTPRSSFGTPSVFGRRDDESASQFSRGSANRGGKITVVKRRTRDEYGQPSTITHQITNARVAKLYKERRTEKQLQALSSNLLDFRPTGDPVMDELKKREIEKELRRIERNRDRRYARENAKKRLAGSPIGGAASPGQSDVDGPPSVVEGSTTGTPQKTGRGRNKDGTARKCANCGQVGHIKTNRKLCPMLNGTMKPDEANPNGDSTFGAVAPKLVL